MNRSRSRSLRRPRPSRPRSRQGGLGTPKHNLHSGRIIPQDEILFLPLGGAGEIGMNLYLYGCAGEWLVVDCGMTFAGDSQPGVDLIFPDSHFLESHKDLLQGIIITHGHEDHIGALPYLWEKLKVPIWLSPFAASLLRSKNEEHHLDWDNFIHVIDEKNHVSLGNFDIKFIPMTHSIPESHAFLIETPHGRILHSGDWNFDETPPIGAPSAHKDLAAIGKKGVDVLVCDSTNVFVEKREGSERDVEKNLHDLIKSFSEGRVVVTFFASNIARLQSVARAAEAAGRYPVLVGRSMRRYEAAARDNGYLQSVPPFLSDRDVGGYKPHELLYLCTGSQGEPRAAVTRLAEDSHPSLFLEKGDRVLFSSRVIPGNEKRIGHVQNCLLSRGIEVMDADDHFIHISGHPSKEELATLYDLIKPSLLIPVHGEWRHLSEHLRFASEQKIERQLCVINGAVARIKGDKADIMAHVRVGRMALYGNRILPLDHSLMHRRRTDAERGKVIVMIVLDERSQLIADPQLMADGLIDMSDEDDKIAWSSLVEIIIENLNGMRQDQRNDDKKIGGRLRRACEEAFMELFELRPWVEVRVVRVN